MTASKTFFAFLLPLVLCSTFVSSLKVKNKMSPASLLKVASAAHLVDFEPNCPGTCRDTRREARRDCKDDNGIRLSGCKVQKCENVEDLGFECVPEGPCPAECRRRELRAYRDCATNGKLREDCKVQECKGERQNGSKFDGYECVSKGDDSTGPQDPVPQTSCTAVTPFTNIEFVGLGGSDFIQFMFIKHNDETIKLVATELSYIAINDMSVTLKVGPELTGSEPVYELDDSNNGNFVLIPYSALEIPQDKSTCCDAFINVLVNSRECDLSGESGECFDNSYEIQTKISCLE